MVLDEATISSTDTFSQDNVPSSDSDAYSASSPSGGSNAVNIRLHELPSPLPLFGSKKKVARVIVERVHAASSLLKRPVTQDEADALAYHTARMYSIESWSTPVGLAGGFYRGRATHDSFRFPFFSAPTNFNPDVLGPLRGQQARAVWHLARYSMYGLIGVLVAKATIGSYAATVEAVGELQDPRLKELMTTVRQKARATASGLPQSPAETEKHTFGQHRDPTGQGQTEMGELWRRHRSSIGARDQIDMSPIAGNSGDYDGGGGGNDMMSDDEMRTQQARQQAESRRTQAQSTRASSRRMDKVVSQSRSPDLDDASPTASTVASDASSAAAGSAWERVRSNARNSESSPYSPPSSRSSAPESSEQSPWARIRQGESTRSEQRRGSTMGDSFSFSRSDEERQLARDEAQKDFDARVERERRGEDFTGGDQGRRRW